MKRTALRMMIAAAAAMAAVATASAQGMKAEIPFAFQAAGARMQPGSYWLTLKNTGSGATVQMSNLETKKSILALSRITAMPASMHGSNAALSFACTDGQCVLASLKDEHAAVYTFGTGKNAPGARIATVLLKSDRAE